MSLEAQCQTMLALIEQDMTPLSFKTWYQDIKPVSLEKQLLTLAVSSSVQKNMLETPRHQMVLQNAAKIAFENDSLEFELILFDPLTTQKPIPNGSIGVSVVNNHLNQKYTFDTFVVGNSNRFAHAAALAVAESPGKTYNPLFLHGVAGLGKTHLMHAIGHYILGQNPDAKVVYVSSEAFTNELINSIKDDKNQLFRDKYRNIDVLLVDDIQFIAGKESTQEEFFHTFNTLYGSNKQVVLTSDRPPKEITTLEERLRSRFEWGIIGDIQTPDLETRIAILKKKAQSKNYEMEDEIFTYIATKVKSNIRELEGALNQIIAFSAVTKQPINIELVDEALKDYFKGKEKKPITPKLIQEIVAKHFNIKMDDFKSAKRTKTISYPRQIAMYLTRELTNLSLPKIGDEFGNRDHSTVLHGIEKITEDIKKDVYIQNVVDELTKTIQGV